MSTPMPTPNVVISNPKVRLIARTILDVIGAAIFVAIVVDASTDAFNIVAITGPASAGYLALRSIFGLSVDNPNTPK